MDYSQEECAVITNALNILEQHLCVREQAFTSPLDCTNYLKLKLGALEHEVFMVLFLDAQNKLIKVEEMFRGTITQTSVYPREVAKAALLNNAVSVVLAHNHPSGGVQPSRADEVMTQILKNALALVDVRVLDHIIIGGSNSLSMAEKGLV